MARRFTDTEKWEDPWFGELEPVFKLAWVFICDRCDHAGFWKWSTRSLLHHCGIDLSAPARLKEFVKAFEGRLINVGRGTLYVRGFLEWQYRSIDTVAVGNSRVMISVRKLIEQQGVEVEFLNKENHNAPDFGNPLDTKAAQTLSKGLSTKTSTRTLISRSTVGDRSTLNERKPMTKKAERQTLLGESPRKRIPPKIPMETIQRVADIYNEVCAEGAGMRPCMMLSQKREQLIKRFWFRCGKDWDEVRDFFKRVTESDFLTGRKGAWKGADLTWLMDEEHSVKVWEGGYAE